MALLAFPFTLAVEESFSPTMNTIKNIVFDLGNVLLDLHLNKTEEAFRELLQEEFEPAYLKYEADRLFERLEIGVISPFEFITGMRAATSVPITDEEVLEGWNALLGDLPKQRIDLLRELAENYRIFLLSNTNAIHMMWLNEYLEDNYNLTIQDFTDLFEKHFFSFQIKLRKPQAEIFQYILDQTQINAAETMLVDDRLDNIEAAKKLGFQTFQHDPANEISSVLPELLKG